MIATARALHGIRAMHLVQILLPLLDRKGAPQPLDRFRLTERELVDRFGGVTAYERAPARGRWLAEGGRVERDEIVTIEVMTEALDRSWWKGHRARLAERFEQAELVIRAIAIEPL